MFTSLGNVIPRNGLVGEWLLDGNALDTSGSGNNGTATNVTYVKTNRGYQAQAGSFGGSSYITASSNGNLNGDFTIIGWFNALTQTAPAGDILNFGIDNFSIYLRQHNISGGYTLLHPTIQWNISQYTEYNLPSRMNLGWTFFTMTVNRATNKFQYSQNGVFQNELTIAGIGTFNNSMNIGQSTGNNYRFIGQIQGVRIYNRALSQDEIQLLYLEGQKLLGPTNIAKYPKLFEGLTAYYDFRGDVQNIVDGTFNGTLVNSPTLTTDLFGNSKGYNFVRASAQHINGVKKLDDSLNNRTINFLINNDNNPGGNDLSLYTQWTSGLPYILMGINSANKFWFYNGISAILTTGTVSGINLITVTKSGTTYKIYINGVLDASGTISTASPGGVLNTQFANRPDVSGYSYQGKIYEVTMFNRVFSDDEASIMNSLIKSNYIYPSPSYDLPNLRDGLVLDLNEQGKDLSGNGNHGILVNSPTVVRQGKAKGLSYNGSNQALNVIMNIPDDITINIPVIPTNNPSSGTYTKLFSIDNGTTGDPSPYLDFSYDHASSQYLNASSMQNTTSNSTCIAKLPVSMIGGQFSMITVTFNSSTNILKVYKDGIFQIQSTFTGTRLTKNRISFASFYDTVNSQYMNGKIFNPKVWSRVLSDREIQQLYYSLKGNYIY